MRWLRLEDFAKKLNLNLGKKTRLQRILYEHGPGNGMALILPIDHALEHGPRDFFANPESIDLMFQLRLAKEGGFSAIIFHIGLAEKYLLFVTMRLLWRYHFSNTFC